MNICKHPVYNSHLVNVAMELVFSVDFFNQEQIYDLDNILSPIIATIDDSHPIFVPYGCSGPIQALNLPNPLVYRIDASEIGSNYPIQELRDSDKAIALFMRDISDLAYLNLVDYVGLSHELIEQNNVGRLIRYIHARRNKVIAFDIHDQIKYKQFSKLPLDFYSGNFLHNPSFDDGVISANKINLLNLVNQLQNSDVNFQDVSDIINNDPALSYELLKVANSAAFSSNKRIESVQQAVVRLGFLNLKNLVMTIAMKNVSDKPIEVIETGLIRAHMCQSLARDRDCEDTETYYTLGLLSIIDVLLDKPMDILLKKTSLSEDLAEALMNRKGPLGDCLNTVINYEQGRWNDVGSNSDLCQSYIKGSSFANQTISVMKH